jgi:polyphosphate glucokinase
VVVGEALGIDIGGSGIKGAPVALDRGELAGERHRIATPDGGKPGDVAATVAELVAHFDWRGPVGITFPGAIRGGLVRAAANLHRKWAGLDPAQTLARDLEHRPVVLNDADAAGLAEVTFGAAEGEAGTTLLLTLGTGIGSALIRSGELVSGTELGHLEFKGGPAEDYAAAQARKAKKLTWKAWGKRVGRYLRHLELVLAPDLFVIGGGVSRRFEKFAPHLEVETPVVPAALRNEAGIIGAAIAAAGGGKEAHRG